MSDALALLVPPGTSNVLAIEAQKARASAPQIAAIGNEQTLVDIRQHVKHRLAELDSERKGITGHLDKAKKAIDALYKPVRDVYDEIVSGIDAKLSAAERARRDAAAAAQAQARALAAQGQVTPVLPPEAPRPVGVGFVESWEHVPSEADIRALAAAVAAGTAPFEFLRLDDSAIRIWLRQFKDSTYVPPVPGLPIRRVSKPRTA
jgi:Skp family chaperone for outer membrane proteins